MKAKYSWCLSKCGMFPINSGYSRWHDPHIHCYHISSQTGISTSQTKPHTVIATRQNHMDLCAAYPWKEEAGLPGSLLVAVRLAR